MNIGTKNPISRIFNWYLSKQALPYWSVLLLDCCIVFACGLIGLYWEFGGNQIASHFWQITSTLLVYIVCFYCVAFRIRHTYSGIIRYSSFEDLMHVGVAMSIGTAISFAASEVIEFATETSLFEGLSIIYPTWKTLGFIFTFGTLLMVFARVVGKAIYDGYRMGGSRRGGSSVLIYGTLAGGIGLAKGLRNSANPRFTVRGFISATEGVGKNIRMMGMNVYPCNEDLIHVIKSRRITGIVVSPLQIDNFLGKQEIIDQLTEENIKIFMMQDAQLWDGKSDINQSQLHEVDIEDLLPRDKIEVDMDAIGALLKGKRILITGAAGSIGSEMVRQVCVYKPEEMILIDQAETPMHDIRLMMARDYSDIKSETIVTSITNKEHMEKIFAEHKPEYVFHAAAYKHVPMMEDNPAMAVQNNIYGTRVIADLAVKYGTKKFVMISTDKAVNPTNVMGCSKRICEIYCQSLNAEIKAFHKSGMDELPKDSIIYALNPKPCTQFVTTRFGNVLGSNGSVIPLFKRQIQKGGPITVTHPDIIRFFMLIPEACKLVLEAGTMGQGGEIFVFDMGKPVKIVDLAKRMIRLSGAKNIEIKFTGLRDGEKLYEEVLNDAETTKPTKNSKIMIAAVREYEYATACENEERLLQASYSFDDMAIVKIMKEIVPEYKSKCSKYEALDK